MAEILQKNGAAVSPDDGGVQLHLSLFGSFELLVDGQAATAALGHASKLRSLLCYLVLHRERAVSHGELFDLFYGDESQTNPEGALKMQVLRLRQALKPQMPEGLNPVLGSRGAYRLNPELRCWVDAEEFERFCSAAEQPGCSEEDRLYYYGQAAALYTGSLVLAEDDLLWSRTAGSRYAMRYLNMVERYAALLAEWENFSLMERVCRRGIEQDATNEALYILLIRSLLKQKRFAEARSQYKRIVDLLYRELGVRPSPELEAMYAQCEAEELPWEEDLSSIMISMRNPEGKREALLCGFEQFRSIYQLEVRRALRLGGCLHVAMLTLGDAEGKLLPTRVNNVIMEQLGHVVVSRLRQSDVVARYSSCQYIIMLPYANLEDSCMVIERIISAYHGENPNNVVSLSYQVRELELV